MARYFKAEYQNGKAQERWDLALRGLKLNGVRPHTISLVPECPKELLQAQFAVDPVHGKVVELYVVPLEHGYD